jgi:hypothetical protein
MDLTIPYTFYPVALPHSIAWALFSVALALGGVWGLTKGQREGLRQGVLSGLIVGLGSLFATMLASMVITFFVHDS